MNDKTEKLIFEDLKGKTLTSAVQVADNEVILTTDDGIVFSLYHEDECCEDVYIEDICGDLNDLVGSEILVAEEVGHAPYVTPEGLPEKEVKEDKDHFTWTFYKLDTRKGGVTIRWYGNSNGHYSEKAQIRDVTPKNESEKTLDNSPSNLF